MSRTLLFLFFLTAIQVTYGQTTIHGSFEHGGIIRTFSYYVPATYVPGQPAPMLIGLHGLGSSGEDFAQYRDFRSIADSAGLILVHPDGSSILGIKFWNYGNIPGSEVDDVGFIEILIDHISAQYSINQNRIYCVGMSNGGFMAYALACRSSRFAAIGSVTGSMGVDTYNSCLPDRPLPVIHIHGTEDSVNPYSGTSTSKSIDDVIKLWVNKNGCNIMATNGIPNIDQNDGATAEKQLYSGGINGNKVALVKVKGGGHSWPGSPTPGSNEIICMDFDARMEIWNFFRQFELNGSSRTSKPLAEIINIFPNPSHGLININSGDLSIKSIQILDINGNLLKNQKRSLDNTINARELKAGVYILKIYGKDFLYSTKIILL